MHSIYLLCPSAHWYYLASMCKYPRDGCDIIPGGTYTQLHGLYFLLQVWPTWVLSPRMSFVYSTRHSFPSTTTSVYRSNMKLYSIQEVNESLRIDKLRVHRTGLAQEEIRLTRTKITHTFMFIVFAGRNSAASSSTRALYRSTCLLINYASAERNDVSTPGVSSPQLSTPIGSPLSRILSSICSTFNSPVALVVLGPATKLGREFSL